MAPSTVAALIAAVASLVGSAMAWVLKRHSDERIAQVQRQVDLDIAQLQETLRSEAAKDLTRLEDTLAEAGQHEMPSETMSTMLGSVYTKSFSRYSSN